jgi:thiamine biosynthesis lipoprotein
MKNIQSVIIFRLITTILLLLSSLLSFAQVQQSKTANLMGSVFQITLVDKDSIAANQHILDVIAEMERIENLISEWRPNTQISEVNRNAGIKPLKVDKEVFELTKRAIGFSKMTKGAFDISIVAE